MGNVETLYDEFIRRLLLVNDETKTTDEHRILFAELSAWKDGVLCASGYRFNGDYYYIEKFKSGELDERPICCGVFLDWRSK
jgi:hypothetical protein